MNIIEAREKYVAKEKHFQVKKRTVPSILIVITIIELMEKYYNGVL